MEYEEELRALFDGNTCTNQSAFVPGATQEHSVQEVNSTEEDDGVDIVTPSKSNSNTSNSEKLPKRRLVTKSPSGKKVKEKF